MKQNHYHLHHHFLQLHLIQRYLHRRRRLLLNHLS
jgi:hypothetical protein